MFGAYFPFRVLIISPKFRLKTPSGFGDPSVKSLGLFCGLNFGGKGGTTDPVQVVLIT
jgi:hypothetical protein